MELWGGHECTVNRVGDRYRDQTRLTGHHDRPGDIDAFAALGIRKLRYPVLWERVAPDRPEVRDWRWSDERLVAVTRAGMRPIVGLLHHGSGPAYTSLVDDRFSELFAEFASAAARRYPDVEDWTPINEPLTTARFSALYGHWHPHARDERLFWRALLNQVDATRGAMRAIRRVSPRARLVQTEDLGRHYSTATLAGVAEHLNHRRWATWDLLCGRMTHGHPLWDRLRGFGFEDRLRAIADDPCPPDVVGVNHYVTSERFLDDRPGAPSHLTPATGYHDVAAARVLVPSPPGLAGVLREAWDRYRLPIAVTECHLGCSREEQLRWLWRSWEACRRLAREGVDVRALTAWALIGNFDWNSLLTVDAGHYEPGAFDVRGGDLRPTALARFLRVLGKGGGPAPGDFPGLDAPGWWERDLRLEHPTFAWAGPAPPRAVRGRERPLVIVGGSSPLTPALARECDLRGLPHLVTDAERAGALLDDARPWAVVQAGGTDAALAEACGARNVRCAIVPADAKAAVHGAGDLALVLLGPGEGSMCAEDGETAALDPRVLARLCLDLLVDHARGVWRLTGAGEDAWFDRVDDHLTVKSEGGRCRAAPAPAALAAG